MLKPPECSKQIPEEIIFTEFLSKIENVLFLIFCGISSRDPWRSRVVTDKVQIELLRLQTAVVASFLRGCQRRMYPRI